jgi:GNAT superfamily N-acetyltransferase
VIDIIRTNSQNQDFIDLVKLLDADLAIRDDEELAFYDEFNKIDTLKHCLAVYECNKPIACGAIKQFEFNTMEIKRMYVLPEYKGKKIAQDILSELENGAKELGIEKCILETGKKQPKAISLYKNCGYTFIPNYGQYAGIENSVCFEKFLI